MGGDDPEFVLVHSPLVGPSTWQPVAQELETRGRAAVVPRLVDVAHAPAPQWRHVCDLVAGGTAHITRPVLLVGHSGAGLLLPAIADAVSCEVAATIFVDAFLPPPAGPVALAPPEMLDRLRSLAGDGLLPRWSEWFGEHAMRELVPDDTTRARLEEEMPRLPLSYFEAGPRVRAGWDRRPCAYVLLSEEPYGVAAADARGRGWPVTVVPNANHLSLVTDPEAVAASLLAVEAALA